MTAGRHLRTPLCDLLGCRYPILQAGMGGVARAELVSAVSCAGGYGFLGMFLHWKIEEGNKQECEQ